jgi:hypothetical protein
MMKRINTANPIILEQNIRRSQIKKTLWDDIMRKITFSHGISVVLLMIIFGMLFSSIASAQEVPVADAINSGDISATFTSTGSASGYIADLQVTNTGNTEITLDLENSGLEGMVLDNPNIDEQPEVITDTPGVSYVPGQVTRMDNVTIQPGESVTIPVIGYCLDFEKATPSLGTVFTLTSTTPNIDMPTMINVIDTAGNYSYPGYYTTDDIQTATQIAIWAAQPVNNDVTLADYANRGYTLDDNDVTVVTGILNDTGIETQDIVALSGKEKEEPVNGEDGEEDTGLSFPLILLPVIILIALVIAVSVIRAYRKPGGKDEKPPIDAGADKVVVKGPVASSYANKKKECEKLKKKCDEAKKAAENAENKAKEAEEKAEDAELELGEAKDALEGAKEGRRDAEAEPEDTGSWAESEGRRVTSRDLKLKKDASKALWEKYQSGEIDAKTLEKGWEELGESDAIDELRKKDKDSRIEGADEVLDKAEMDVENAEEKTEKAKNEAQSAKNEAKKAKENADKLCKEAQECFESLKAEAEKAKAAKAAEGKAKGPKEGEEGEAEVEEPEESEEDTEETEETTEDTTETREEPRETETEESPQAKEVDEKSKSAQGNTGKIKTTFFGPRLGEPGLQTDSLTQESHMNKKELYGPWKDFWGVQAVYDDHPIEPECTNSEKIREEKEQPRIFGKEMVQEKKIRKLPFTNLDPSVLYIYMMQLPLQKSDHDKPETSSEKKMSKK